MLMSRNLRNLLVCLLIPGLFGLAAIPFTSSSPVAAQGGNAPAGFTAVDFRQWNIVGAGDGWNIGLDGTQATRLVNGSPTYVVSPESFSAVEVEGTLFVDETEDDDIIGFVFGLSDPSTNSQDTDNTEFDHVSFSWKQGGQDGAPEGFLLSRVERVGIGSDDFAVTFSPPTEVLAARTGRNTGWQDRTSYDFRAVYTPTRVEIFIDDEAVFEVDGTFESGKIGVFTSSQVGAQFSDFSYRSLDDRLLTTDAGPDETATEGAVVGLDGSATGGHLLSQLVSPSFNAAADSRPEAACPSWTGTIASEVVPGDPLVVTSSNGQRTTWNVPLLAEQDITVTADVRVLARTGNANRSPAALNITTSNRIGATLWITEDEMFLSTSESAAADRFPIDGTVRNLFELSVSPEGDVAASLNGTEVLTGTTLLLSSFFYGPGPDVRFGDISGGSGGEVEWYSVDVDATAVAGACDVVNPDPGEVTATYQWEQLSGSPVQLSSMTVADPSFTATENGTYRFRLTATAGELSDSDIVTVIVDNVEPAIAADATASVADGAVLLTASLTDPGILDSHTILVDWGDGTPPTSAAVPVQGAGWGAASVAHIYQTQGSYTATVTVRDDDGGEASTSVEIEINVGGPAAPVPGIALWANGTSTQDQDNNLRVAGRELQVEGRSNSNGNMVVNGDGVSVDNTDDSFTVVDETIETGRNHDALATDGDEATPPVNFDVADYRPNGRAAQAAGAFYVDLSSECNANAATTWTPQSTIAAGLYWSPCEIDLTNPALTFEGAVTIASDAAIRVSGHDRALPLPFIDGLSLFANGSPDVDATPGSTWALKITGDGNSFPGAVVSPHAELRVAGIGHQFTCGALGRSVLVTGQGHRFDQTSCPTGFVGAPELDNAITGPPVIIPALTADINADATVTSPGGLVTFDATITNSGSRLAIPGLLQLQNLTDESVTVNAAVSELQVYDVRTDAWRSVANGEVVGIITPDVDVTTDGLLEGTQIAPNATATIGLEAVFDLDPAQLAELFDPSNVADTRIIVSVDATDQLTQTLRIDGELNALLAAASADATDLDATVTAPGAPAVPVTAPTLAPGESVSAAITVAAPTASPIAPNETNDAFATRLEALDGSIVAAGVTGSATGSIGTLPVAGVFDSVEVDLPVIRSSFSAPSSERAGNTVNAVVSLTNTGSAPAELAVVAAESVAGSLSVAGVPDQLAAGATVSGTVSYDIPTDRVTSLTETVDVSFTGVGIDLELRPQTQLVDVLVSSTLDVTKRIDFPPGTLSGQALYIIEVRNTGDDPITGVTLSDTPAPVLPLVDGTLTTTRGDAQATDGTITVEIGELGPNDAALIEYRIDFASTNDSITSITNQAIVSSNELAEVLSDDPSVDGAADPTVFTFRVPIGGGGDVIGWFGDPSLTGDFFTPPDGSLVTEPTQIAVDFAQVQVPDGRAVETWRLVAAPYGDPDAAPVVVASGTGTPPNTLGTFDPSLVENGPWRMTLEMIDDTGELGVVETSVIVEGQLKLGRFSLTYEDMTVDVGGLPMSVLRTYDTLDRNQSGDFGHGWNLDIANFRISSNGPLGLAGWEQYSCGQSGLLFVGLCYRSSKPHFVSVTWPNGQVESFDFTPDGTSTFFAGQAVARYTARDQRTTSTLAPAPGDSTAFYDSNSGIIRAGGFGEGGTYDPKRFILTDRFGTEYVIDSEAGLIEAIDRNGNSVRVTDDGIVSSNGPSINFDRDDAGRITSATGPDGESVSYSYDTDGDLVAAIDQKGEPYSFTYGSAANGGEHYLTGIDDPGSGPQRILTYDDDGRLAATTDAEGNVTQVDVNIDDRTEIITSPDGLLTTVSQFDARGNATEVNDIYDGGNHVSSLTYDDLDQVTARTDPNGNVWTGTYDADRNLRSFSNAEAETTSFTYDDYGFPTSVTDAENATTNFSYDSRGNLTSIADARGGVQRFTFDRDGNQLTRTDQVDRTWSWSYDGANRVRTVTDPRSNTTTFGYDGQGRMTSVKAADDGVTSYGYDDVGNPTSVTDPLNRTTRYVYDERDRLDVMTDPAGGATRYAYDDNDRLVSRIDPTGRLWQNSYSFDRLDTVTAPDFGTTRYAYDGAGRLSTMTDTLGRVSSYGYDPGGRRTTVVSPISPGVTATSSVAFDGNGRVVSRTNGENETTTFSYDGRGLMLTMVDPLNRATSYVFDAVGNRTSMTNAAAETTTWVYDLASQVTSVTNAESETTTYGYDGAGNRTLITDPLDRSTMFGYDPVNRQNSVTMPSGDIGSTVYNRAGEVTSSVSPAGYGATLTYDPRGLVETVSDPLGNTVGTAYDEAGRRTVVTDARGNATSFSYDAVGRLESETDPLGGMVSFGYDLAGQRVSVTDANDATRQFDFDQGGRLVEATDALGRSTTYSYDLVGRRVGMIDARGVVTAVGFDDAGQVVSATAPNEVRSYTYDGAGRRTQMTDGSGITDFTFDGVGRLVGVGSAGGSVSYVYNDAGERVSMTQPAGVVRYGYDINGYLGELVDWRGDTVSVSNDADGRVVGVERSNGVGTVRRFDGAGRLDQVAHSGPSGVIDSYTYSLDGNGNRTQVTSAAGDEVYVLDELNRLTSVAYGDGTSEVFGYDDQGYRIAHQGRDGVTTTYSVDAAGQLVSDSDGVGYSYDQSGNLVSTSVGDSYVWDDYGRLTRATVEGVTETYGYDGDDVRVVVDGGVQVWDRAGLPTLVETADDSFVHAAGGGVLRAGDDWLLEDGVGSVRVVVDDAGVVLDSLSYQVFGERFGSGGAGFGFGGEQHDGTGLQYLRARQFDPGLGRFLSVDPVQPGAPGTTGWNLYAYAGNNPSTWTDPTGEAVLAEYSWSTAAVGAVVGGLFSPFVCQADESKGFTDPSLRLDGRCVAASIVGGAVFGGLSPAGKLGGRCGSGALVGAVEGYLASVASGRGDPVADAAAGGVLGCGVAGLAPVLSGVFSRVSRSLDGVFGRVRQYFKTGDPPSIRPVSGGPCSFSAETEVLLGDGSSKPISEIEVGDVVLAEDPQTGERGSRTVTHLWAHQDSLVDLEIDDVVVATTEDHPFWNHTDAEWQRADSLDPGDLVLAADGDLLPVNGVDWETVRTETAHNLTVDGIHTYYVQVGDDHVLVHNTNPLECQLTLFDPDNPNAPSGTAQVLTNQRIGNAAADSIASRFPGSAREVSLQAASGRRVVDVLTDTGLAIESKVGRTSLTTATRRQIARDVELMTDLSSPVSSVRWEFFTSPVTGRGGPTGPLAQALNDAGIPFVVHP